MATASVILTPGAATLPDGSAGNAAPGITRRKGINTPAQHYLTLDYSGSAGVAHAWWTFRMPVMYGSGGTLDVLWQCVSTTGNVKWQARLGAVTPGDADTPDQHAMAALSTVTTAAVAAEARRLNLSSITLALDSAAAGDLIFLVLLRDAGDAADTCTGVGEVLVCEFGYDQG